METARPRSRSSSHDDSLTLISGQRLVIQNTFFQLVGWEEPRSTTPPRRRVLSAGPTEFPSCRPQERAARAGQGVQRRKASRPPMGKAAVAGGAPALPVEQLTTVVIRGMPQTITRDAFLDVLKAEGFEKEFDFVYLPIDFGRQCSFGYAFVNCVSTKAAQRFHEVFTGYSTWVGPWNMEAEVGWATLQGLDEHIEKYRNSPVMHQNVGDESKPILLKDGERVEFPAPTKKIGLVKRLRTRRKSRERNAEKKERIGSPEPQGLLSWDYQDTDEELQPTKQYCRPTAAMAQASSPLLLLAGLEPAPPTGGSLLESALELVEPEQPKAGGIPRRNLLAPPTKCAAGSDVEVLSDCSTRVPTSQSIVSGSSGSSGRGRRPGQQQLAASFSVLAGGLVKDTTSRTSSAVPAEPWWAC